MMRWPEAGEKTAAKTTIREDDTEATRAAKIWEKELEGMSASGTWTWWTHESRTDDVRVQTALVGLSRER